MTITQSGGVGTGRITVANEASVTLSDIASAVSGMTLIGNGAYHLDRDIEFLNSNFSMLRETLVITADIRNSGTYGNGTGRRPPFFIRDDSTVDWQSSNVSFNVDQRGNVFVPWFGNSQPGFNTGQFTAEGCIFFLGDLVDWDVGAFFRMNNVSAVFNFQDNQFIGGDPTRGWGSIFGDPASIMRGNRSFGSAVANIPNSPSEDNFAQDADIYMQFNTNFEVDVEILNPTGGNFSSGTIQVLLRKPGTFNCFVRNCDLPRTYQNFNPRNNNNERANLLWTYDHNATVTDAFDSLPEQDVQLDIVPTTQDVDSIATRKVSDVNGQFSKTDVLHSRDFFRGINTPVNTLFGPFRIRYAKYGFIFRDRSGDAYDRTRGVEEFRMLRDASIVEASEASVAAYMRLDTLDQLRDRWHYERLADLALNDTGAGGGAITSGGYNLTINSGAGTAFEESGGTISIRPTGALMAGSAYGTLIAESGDTITATTPVAANLTAQSGGAIRVSDLADLTGTLTLSGTLTVTAAGGGAIPSGSAASTGQIVVSAASANDRFNAEAFTFDAASVIENTSGQPIIVELAAGQQQPIAVETSGTITFEAPIVTQGLTITGLEIGSTVRFFEAGTQTEIDSTTASGPSFAWSETFTVNRDVDVTILKDGFVPIRLTDIALTTSIVSQGVQQVIDRAFVTPSGLAFGTTSTVNTGTSRFGVTTATTVQNWYAFMIQSWRTETSLRNVTFPLTTNGPNSFELRDGWEFAGAADIANLSQDGLRYTNGGAVTAIWAAIFDAAGAGGLQTRFQQVEGTTQAAAGVGAMDELVQVFGDAAHGSFDRTGYLVLKAQGEGFDEAVTDVVSVYGTLEDQLYTVALSPLANGVAVGDPGITGVTITDHGASPVTWNGESYSITIQDTGGNSGADILRWFRFNVGQGGTFQGKDAFNWHDLARTNGANFRTVRGEIYGDTGAVLKGVRVVTADGTSPHPDFDLFTADNGTTFTPPLSIQVGSASVPQNARVQLFNVTQGAEIDNSITTGAGYSIVLTEGGPYNAGDTLRLRVAPEAGVTASLPVEAIAIASTSNVSFPINIEPDDIYNANGLNGSTLTAKFAGDYLEDEIDILVAQPPSPEEIYAWWVYNLTTEQGIREFWGGMIAEDRVNYRQQSSVVSVFIDNLTPDTLVSTTGSRFYREDGARPVKNPTTGGGDVDINWRNKALAVQVGGSALATDERAKLLSLDTTNLDVAVSTRQEAGQGAGLDEQSLHDALDSYPNKDGYKADPGSGSLTPTDRATLEQARDYAKTTTLQTQRGYCPGS